MLTSATPDGPEPARRAAERAARTSRRPTCWARRSPHRRRRPAVVPGRDGRHGPGRAGADGDGGRARDRSTKVPASAHALRGRVRIASSPEEAIDTMEPGDVLVVRATSPAFNAVLAIAGGRHRGGRPAGRTPPCWPGAGHSGRSRRLRRAGPHGRCDVVVDPQLRSAPSPSDFRAVYVRCDGNDAGDGCEVIRYDFYDPPTVVAVGWAESRGQTNAVGVVRALRPDGTPLPWHGST